MSAAAILSECRRRGIELRPAGDMLRFRPVAAVDDELRAALSAHKRALLALLAGGVDATQRTHPADAPAGDSARPGRAPDRRRGGLHSSAPLDAGDALPLPVADRVSAWLVAAGRNNGEPTTFYADDLRPHRAAIAAHLGRAGARVSACEYNTILRFTLRVAR